MKTKQKLVEYDSYCAGHCPKCESEEIEYRELEWLDESCYFPSSCLDCKLEFKEHYNVVYSYSIGERFEKITKNK
tara:strand:- start:490 stop:714 length:225 start_codon:yes stop_codon:yes gene_type:complete